jgi:hypothetical protein
MAFLELFTVRPAELDAFTVSQIRELADRADTLIEASNRQQAEQQG